MFVGKIPRDLYEDELVPLFESAGPIWDLRLMMDPLSGQNRGYAFITYCNKDDAQKAVKLVSGWEGFWKNVTVENSEDYVFFCIIIASFCFIYLHCVSTQLPLCFIFSVITMKFALASIWECVYLFQTIGCLLDQFQRTRQGKVYWKTLEKLQVSFKCTGRIIS